MVLLEVNRLLQRSHLWDRCWPYKANRKDADPLAPKPAPLSLPLDDGAMPSQPCQLHHPRQISPSDAEANCKALAGLTTSLIPETSRFRMSSRQLRKFRRQGEPQPPQ